MDDTVCAPLKAGELLFVQYGGFRKHDGASEYATLMCNLMAHVVELSSFQDGDTSKKRRLAYSLYIIRDNSGCFMCAGSAESPSFHVVALLSGWLYDDYFSSVHFRLEHAALNDGICSRARQCCGYVIRRIPAIVYRSMSGAWRESIIVPSAAVASEMGAHYGCFT